MIGIVVAAHGDLAQALVDTAKLVVPDSEQVRAVSVTTGDSSGDFEFKLQKSIEELSHYDGVLILTDMFGGTPSQVSMMKHAVGDIEVLTGANLPMLIKALQLSGAGETLDSTTNQTKDSGKRAIVIASELLGARTVDSEVDEHG